MVYRATPEQMWEAIVGEAIVPDELQAEYARKHAPLPLWVRVKPTPPEMVMHKLYEGPKYIVAGIEGVGYEICDKSNGGFASLTGTLAAWFDTLRRQWEHRAYELKDPAPEAEVEFACEQALAVAPYQRDYH